MLEPRVLLDNAERWSTLAAERHSGTEHEHCVKMATMFTGLATAAAIVSLYEGRRRR